MRRIDQRQLPVGVIQICWIEPGPSISAIVKVALDLMTTEGLIFQPWPSSRAAPDPVPFVAIPPAPLAPLKFSGLIERLCALDNIKRLPRCESTPLKDCCAQTEVVTSTAATSRSVLICK